jgi:hypothetical protein
VRKKGTVITGALLAGLIAFEPAAHMLHPEDHRDEAIVSRADIFPPPEHTHEDHPIRHMGEPLVAAASTARSFDANVSLSASLAVDVDLF